MNENNECHILIKNQVWNNYKIPVQFEFLFYKMHGEKWVIWTYKTSKNYSGYFCQTYDKLYLPKKYTPIVNPFKWWFM